MRFMVFLLIFSFGVAVSEEVKEKEKRIRRFALSTEQIFVIPVHYTEGVTTIMFPAEIEAIHAANIALNVIPQGATPAFLMAYNPGSYYFSVRALREKAEGYANIVYGGKTYILRLVENREAAWSSVSFQGGGSGSRAAQYKQPGVSPWLLKSCLDKAKAWDVLKKQNDTSTEDVTVSDRECTSDYGAVKCKVKRVWRFDKYDVLVFYITLTNNSDKVLYYNPRETALAVADKKCFAALSDASGEMPPKSETILFCVITGAHDGTRNLAADNEWKILLFAYEQKQPGKL